jgi:hypothetical protein
VIPMAAAGCSPAVRIFGLSSSPAMTNLLVGSLTTSAHPPTTVGGAQISPIPMAGWPWEQEKSGSPRGLVGGSRLEMNRVKVNARTAELD